MIRPLETFDVSGLKVQDKQRDYKDHINKLALGGHLYDGFSYLENGQVKAVFGMQPFWAGRSIVWALIGDIESWIKLHKQVKSLMESYAIKRGILRIEMTTEEGFIESQRWAKLLGFEYESTMQNFGVDGKNHKMWVRLWQQQSRL